MSFSRYPSATEKELADYSDDCAICRDSMSSAKVLPCGHIFHLFCIRSWLEHHSSCPTCRRSLLSELDSSGQPTDDAAEGALRAEDQRSGAMSATEDGLRGRTDRSQRESRRGSFASTSSPHPVTPSTSGSSSATTHHSFNGGHSTPLSSLASGSAHHSSNSGSHSNRSSTGHQLFAFNSEQQPWLTRLGFPRITVEVVDPTEEDDQDTDRNIQRRTQTHHRSHEDSMRHSGYPPPSTSSSSVHHDPSDDEFSDEDDEDLRRAIAESLAMSQATQSQSTVSLPSTMTATSKTPETIGSLPISSTSSLRHISGATAFLRGASRRSSLEISSWPPSPEQHHQHQPQQQQHEDSTVMRRRRDNEDGKLSGCDLKVD